LSTGFHRADPALFVLGLAVQCASKVVGLRGDQAALDVSFRRKRHQDADSTLLTGLGLRVVGNDPLLAR
jgi:hypothetical protein